MLIVLAALSEKYAWEDFLKSLSSHLKKAYEPLIAPYMRRHALTAPPVTSQPTAGITPETGQPNDRSRELDDMDLIEQATQAATQAALQSVGYGTYNGQSQNGGM
jgi:protein TBF1